MFDTTVTPPCFIEPPVPRWVEPLAWDADDAFFMLGGGNVERGVTWPHYHPKFDFDEACLPRGIELGLRIIEAASGLLT